MTSRTRESVAPGLSDTWYAGPLGLTALDELLNGRLARALAKHREGRGILLWFLGRRRPMVVTTLARTPKTFLLLERLFPRRRRYLVVLEFIPVLGREAQAMWGVPTGWARRLASGAIWRFVTVPVLRRSMAWGQCLTTWEITRSAGELGIEETRFRFVPWFRASTTPEDRSGGRRAGVLASGRAACDWETVFAAARGQGWQLTVVCGAGDLEQVERLNVGGHATVLSEIPRHEHDRLVQHAAVYLLALREAEVSSGQVRLANCWEVGTPVVASSVRGLDGYLEDGRNSLVYEPGDAMAARSAVNELLHDRPLREGLVAGSFEYAREWTRDEYLAELRTQLHQPDPT